MNHDLPTILWLPQACPNNLIVISTFAVFMITCVTSSGADPEGGLWGLETPHQVEPQTGNLSARRQRWGNALRNITRYII